MGGWRQDLEEPEEDGGGDGEAEDFSLSLSLSSPGPGTEELLRERQGERHGEDRRKTRN